MKKSKQTQKRPVGRPKGEETKVIAFRVKLIHIEPIKQLISTYLDEQNKL
jgi:hypothetical protein